MNFTTFNFEPLLQQGLESMGFETATPIQQQAIPVIMKNEDLLACAQTGTGKTAAFLLPILNKLVLEPEETTNTLIIVPTRELALQIDQVLQGFSYFTNVSSIAIYGGSDGNVFEIERRALEQHAHIIVATPGRLIAHLNMGYVRFENIRHLIIDEADRMLDMGFIDDIMKITTFLPKERQTLMFSATMPDGIRKLAKKLLNNPQQINIATSKPAEGVMQAAYYVDDKQKNALLCKLLHGKDDLSVLIFASTKIKVKELERDLKRERLKVQAIHSDLTQPEREDVLMRFR
ncbi:MAG: DEAD/DEAH box helicase, partial [Bacteroidota bacterium]